ncbi:MAG: DUF1579 family protein [Cellvibrionaceae bacterium]
MNPLLLLLLVLSINSYADDGVKKVMNDKQEIPAEVLAYISGATLPEHQEFDFLIGEWKVKGNRLLPNGQSMDYEGEWKADYINDKRMIMDEFKIHSPTGQPVSSYVTLRSYSPLSQRWELTGLAALMPAHTLSEWYGNMDGKEMVLTAKGVTPDGKDFINKIQFHEIGTDSFSWKSSLSFDKGENWIKNGQLVAERL